jgi:hypothetical protein
MEVRKVAHHWIERSREQRIICDDRFERRCQAVDQASAFNVPLQNGSAATAALKRYVVLDRGFGRPGFDCTTPAAHGS